VMNESGYESADERRFGPGGSGDAYAGLMEGLDRASSRAPTYRTHAYAR
jgi:hypothetical protein